MSQALWGVGVFLSCLSCFILLDGVRFGLFKGHFPPNWQTPLKEKTIPKGETLESVWGMKMLPFKREAWGFDNIIFETGFCSVSQTNLDSLSQLPSVYEIKCFKTVFQLSFSELTYYFTPGTREMI